MKNNKGFSLVELLATVIIIGLVSGGLVTGIVLSNKQYKNSIRQSEASELYNTISSLLTYELKFTNQVELDGDKLVAFKSISYQLADVQLINIYVLDEDGNETNEYGKIAFGSSDKKNYLVGNATYTKDLGVILNITYNQTTNLYTVNLDIGYDDKSVIHNIFNVRALNRVRVVNVE